MSLMEGSEVLMMFSAAETHNPGPYKCQVVMRLLRILLIVYKIKTTCTTLNRRKVTDRAGVPDEL